MQRIPYPDPAGLPDTMRRMLEGTPLNVVRVGANASPALFEAQGQISYAIADPKVLDPRVREAAILRVAHLSGSRYELHHHRPLARAAGLSTEEIEAVERCFYDRLDPKLTAVCQFTDEVVARLSPTDETFNALREITSDQLIVNLVLTIGCYMSIARLIAVTGIQPDEPALQHLSSGLDDPSL